MLSASVKFGLMDESNHFPLFNVIIKKFSEVFNIVFENGIMKIAQIFTDKLTTKELCIEDVCVNKEQLKQLLQNSGQSPAS